MDKLYSINSKNGKGYNIPKEVLELEKSNEYYQFFINNDNDINEGSTDSDYSDYEDPWLEYIVETLPGKCCDCNKKLFTETESNYKLLYPDESIFIFTARSGDRYWYIYYHYCTECLSKKLYQWSLRNNTLYPKLRVDGNKFINMKASDIELPSNIQFPKIYRCDYYLANGYRYLDKANKVYSDEENKMYNLLLQKEQDDKL